MDHSFGADGRVRIDLTDEGMFPAALALQPDGKIVVAGTLNYGYGLFWRTVVLRLLGSNGIARVVLARPAAANAVAVQPDGRIVIRHRRGSRGSARSRGRGRPLAPSEASPGNPAGAPPGARR